MLYNYKFKIRFSDSDAYGIVHHSNYYNYFEEARFDFSKNLLNFDVKSKFKFPLIESSCIYRNPLIFDLEYYCIELECEIIDDSKLEFSYLITDEERKKKYAYGKTVHVVIDEDNKLCFEIPNWIKDKIVEKKGRI